jgi:hypothetical protein
MKKIISNTILGLMALVLLVPNITLANFSVSPLLIDVTGEARDAFTYDITVTNQHNRSLRLFASVNEIIVTGAGEIKEFVPPATSDRATTVTSWLEISRGRIDLQPNESKTLPLTIKINPNTPPGLYHAYIGFAHGTNRDEAQAKVLAGTGSGAVLRISVGSKQREYLKLTSFTSDRFSIMPDSGTMTYILENVGDLPIAPSGDIIIYNSRGAELTSIDVEGGEEIQPGEKREYTVDLPYLDRIGKNKAFLTIEYGKSNLAAVYDTNFYYSLPWFYIVIISLAMLLLLVVLVMAARKVRPLEGDVDEAYEVPLYQRDRKEHTVYEHDLDLKNK